MAIALLMLVPVLVMAAWVFFRSSPRVGASPQVARFNLGVLIIGLMGCAVLTVKVYLDLATSHDRAWWPVVAALYSLVFFPVVLLVGGLVRNLLVFRPPGVPGPRP